MPYALISVEGTPDRIADANGIVTVVMSARDSLRISVRRIGFNPLDGWARRAAIGDAYEAAMTPLAAIMDTVRVVERKDTPLARKGFYDRVERVKKSAMLGEFITPEELEARHPVQLSDILQGRQYARIATMRLGGLHGEIGRPATVVQGRGRCAMNVVVDGQFVSGTTQDLGVSGVPTSIRMASAPLLGSPIISLDDIVNASSVMAIEIYPSIANAPAELIPTASHGACGLVVIWTGPRR